MRRDAEAFVERFAPRARFFVFGHYHRAALWGGPRRVFVNTGCFSRFARLGGPLAVIVEPLTLSVWPVRRRAGEYHLAADPLARFARTQALAAAA
jgi:hypothetical protein